MLVTSFIGVTSICPAFAAESEVVSSVLVETEDCSKAKDEFMADIEMVTMLMEMNLGRDNIDIANASIGQPFLVENSDIYIFPVLVDGKIELLIQMTKDDDGENYFAISEFFADGIDDLSDNTYKIVADEDFDVFAISDNESILINQNKDDEESINDPITALSADESDAVDIKNTFLDLASLPMVAASNVDATESGKWLGVSVVKQSRNTCWAACMSSIMKYHGDNISVSQILNRTGKSGTANSTEVETFFNDYGYSNEGFTQYTLSFSNIKTKIRNGRPIWQTVGTTELGVSLGGHRCRN